MVFTNDTYVWYYYCILNRKSRLAASIKSANGETPYQFVSKGRLIYENGY
ncbi:MAG: hypothetical protein SPH44_01945 [Eubacteriales bacterium]|nr:hypothetical protein [Eubacteriales bacterium]